MAHPLVAHWGRPGSLPLSPPRPPPVPVPPGQGWDPWLHPLSIVLPSCLCACGCACTCAPFKEQKCTWSLRQGVVCAGGGEGPSVWCYPCLLCPWVSALWVLFPRPHSCCPAPPGWWAKLLVRTGSSGRWEGLLTSPREPPRPNRPPEGPWMGSTERIKDAQGNTGLRCL